MPNRTSHFRKRLGSWDLQRVARVRLRASFAPSNDNETRQLDPTLGAHHQSNQRFRSNYYVGSFPAPASYYLCTPICCGGGMPSSDGRQPHVSSFQRSVLVNWPCAGGWSAARWGAQHCATLRSPAWKEQKLVSQTRPSQCTPHPSSSHNSICSMAWHGKLQPLGWSLKDELVGRQDHHGTCRPAERCYCVQYCKSSSTWTCCRSFSTAQYIHNPCACTPRATPRPTDSTCLLGTCLYHPSPKATIEFEAC